MVDNFWRSSCFTQPVSYIGGSKLWMGLGCYNLAKKRLEIAQLSFSNNLWNYLYTSKHPGTSDSSPWPPTCRIQDTGYKFAWAHAFCAWRMEYFRSSWELKNSRARNAGSTWTKSKDPDCPIAERLGAMPPNWSFWFKSSLSIVGQNVPPPSQNRLWNTPVIKGLSRLRAECYKEKVAFISTGSFYS